MMVWKDFSPAGKEQGMRVELFQQQWMDKMLPKPSKATLVMGQNDHLFFYRPSIRTQNDYFFEDPYD
jgi:hypothetical protein